MKQISFQIKILLVAIDTKFTNEFELTKMYQCLNTTTIDVIL